MVISGRRNLVVSVQSTILAHRFQFILTQQTLPLNSSAWLAVVKARTLSIAICKKWAGTTQCGSQNRVHWSRPGCDWLRPARPYSNWPRGPADYRAEAPRFSPVTASGAAMSGSRVWKPELCSCAHLSSKLDKIKLLNLEKYCIKKIFFRWVKWASLK